MSIIQTIYGYNSHNVLNKTDFDLNLVGSDGYGETGYESIENLVKQYRDYFNDKTVFYDLGSGIGKIVLHIGLKYGPKKSCGIEYSNERYKTSLGLMDKYNITNQNISFINDNILNCDISDATVIYTDNTLFPNNIDSEIYNMIPTDCLVISRKSFKQSWVNKELFKDGFTSSTNYGTNTIYTFLKKI
jgi:hypothetical protein